MGQAKLRKKNSSASHGPALTEDAVRLVSQALIKLAKAASDNYGGDCSLHAGIGQALLQHLGFETNIVCGEAAWRVGNGDGDVIVHARMPNMVYQGELAFPYHVWLEYGDYIIDFSTYQLAEKAARLDELDGGNTEVEWCPDYIFTKRENASNLRSTSIGDAGLFHYRKDAVIHSKIMAGWNTLDQEDLEAAILIMNNPDAEVKGPRNFL